MTANRRLDETYASRHAEVVPGDWDSAELTVSPEQTAQYVTLYESLVGFDETKADVEIPRLVIHQQDVRGPGRRFGIR